MRRGWLDSKHLHRLIVHTTDDKSVEGCVLRVARDGVVLIQSKFLDGDGQVPLAGEFFIPRDRIAFVQEVRA